jgi:hypothetical protein
MCAVGFETRFVLPMEHVLIHHPSRRIKQDGSSRGFRVAVKPQVLRGFLAIAVG